MPSAKSARVAGRIHLPQEWEHRKPMIEELYMNQRLDLKAAQKIMLSEHGFLATYVQPFAQGQLLSSFRGYREKQYKSRFKIWNWTKYKQRNRSERGSTAPIEAGDGEELVDNMEGIEAMIDHPSFPTLPWVPLLFLSRIDWTEIFPDPLPRTLREELEQETSFTDTSEPRRTRANDGWMPMQDLLRESHPMDPAYPMDQEEPMDPMDPMDGPTGPVNPYGRAGV